jgi:hypothetical protein
MPDKPSEDRLSNGLRALAASIACVGSPLAVGGLIAGREVDEFGRSTDVAVKWIVCTFNPRLF